MLRNNNFEELGADLVKEFKRLSSLHGNDRLVFEEEARRVIEKRINAFGSDGKRLKLAAMQSRLNSALNRIAV